MFVSQAFSWPSRPLLIALRPKDLRGVRGIVDGHSAELAADVAATCSGELSAWEIDGKSGSLRKIIWKSSDFPSGKSGYVQ